LLANLLAPFLVVLYLRAGVPLKVPADTDPTLSISNDLFRKRFLMLKQPCGKFSDKTTFLGP